MNEWKKKSLSLVGASIQHANYNNAIVELIMSFFLSFVCCTYKTSFFALFFDFLQNQSNSMWRPREKIAKLLINRLKMATTSNKTMNWIACFDAICIDCNGGRQQAICWRSIIIFCTHIYENVFPFISSLIKQNNSQFFFSFFRKTERRKKREMKQKKTWHNIPKSLNESFAIEWFVVGRVVLA